MVTSWSEARAQRFECGSHGCDPLLVQPLGEEKKRLDGEYLGERDVGDAPAVLPAASSFVDDLGVGGSVRKLGRLLRVRPRHELGEGAALARGARYSSSPDVRIASGARGKAAAA